MVLAARVVDRLGKGIRTAPRDALIADSSAEGKRGSSFGLHRAMDRGGAVVGVLLAYFFFTGLAKGEYAPVFLWSLVPAMIGVVLLFFVREAKPKEGKQATAAFACGGMCCRASCNLFLVVALIFTLGNSSNTFLLLRADTLGFTPATAILLYLVYNVVYGRGLVSGGRLSDRIGRKRLLVAGYAFYGLVYLGFALVNAPRQAWILWALFGLYGLYIGFTDGVEKALVSDLAPANLRATAIGLHATIVGIGLFPASFIAGQLWDQPRPGGDVLLWRRHGHPCGGWIDVGACSATKIPQVPGDRIRGNGESRMEVKHVSDSQVTLSQLMQPEHVNVLGNVHGGVLMKLMDEAGGLCAARHARRPTVTVVVDTITFLEPIRIGELVTCTRASLSWAGTSMEVRGAAWKQRKSSPATAG